LTAKQTPPASNVRKEHADLPVAHGRPTPRPSLLPKSKQSQRILLERAALLAKKRDDEQSRGGHDSYLLFRLGPSELYGIQWHYLVEVMPGRPLNAVPGAPACIIGLFNRRGKILSALNIAELIDLPDRGDEERGEMIVVQAAGIMVGIVVNQLMGSQSYDPAHLEPPLAGFKKRAHGSYVHGIDQGKVTLLNLEKLLQHLQFRMNDTAL